jgi:hypothetical protein
MNDQIIQKKKREYQKRQSITDRSFVFTKELLTRLEYQEDRKKARDKNYRKLAAEEKHK